MFIVVSILINAQSVLRGPYLQSTGQTSTYICWKTSDTCLSEIKFGTTKTILNITVTDTTKTDDHFIYLNNLLPNTQYYYLVNTTNSLYHTDTTFFYTQPLNTSKQKNRFLALGDCGSGFIQQYNVKSAITYYLQNKYINGILLLGDNAYYGGAQTEFQTGFFDPYKNNFILNNSCIYPAPGNHEYANDNNLAQTHQIPYYDVFNKTPRNGELGGVPSYHKEFYSYNYGNAHFISLDSYGIELSNYHLWDSLGPQYQWLEQDLQQDTSMWKIVYFHHPPFTMGSHNSDFEADLVIIRQKIARLLEKYGVDLVLNGHSHCYERSWLQKGHYDLEATFNKTIHTIDSSSAKYDGGLNSCPYKKTTSNNKGTIYVVAGESGKLGATQGSYPHNSKYFSDNTKAGALYFEIEQNRLDAFYIEEDSLVHDNFTILKNVNKNTQVILQANVSTFSLAASWQGAYLWSNGGFKTSTATYNLSSTTQYIVNDSLNCLADTFNIIITNINENKKSPSLKLYPNPTSGKLFLTLNEPIKQCNVSITNTAGQVVFLNSIQFTDYKSEVDLTRLHLTDGLYYITVKHKNQSNTNSFLYRK